MRKKENLSRSRELNAKIGYSTLALKTTQLQSNPWVLVDQLAGEFDGLSPLDKYDSLTLHDRAAAANADMILLSLYVLDRYVQRRYSYAGIYILETSITERTLPVLVELRDRECRRSIMALHLCQLIYRFTAATRFRISDTSVKQVRINSWGRSLARERLSSGNNVGLLENAMSRIFDAHDDEYRKAVLTLSAPLDDRTAVELRDLNQRLPIKLVQ